MNNYQTKILVFTIQTEGNIYNPDDWSPPVLAIEKVTYNE